MAKSSDDCPAEKPGVTHAGCLDRHIGARIRERREQLGLSQEQLADLIGVSVRTVARYEHGSMRVGAARLVAVSSALSTTIVYFFERSPELQRAAASTRRLGEREGEGHAAAAPEIAAKDQVISHEVAEIVRLCAKLDAPRRRELLNLVRAWVAAFSAPAAP